MEKRYAFWLKNWLYFILAFTFLSVYPSDGQAQTTSGILWEKTFGGNLEELIPFVEQTPDGGYLLAGTSQSGISGEKSQAARGFNDFWIIKMDANGNKIWDKTIGGSSVEELNAFKLTSDGGCILGGNSLSNVSGDKSQPSKGGSDYWVVKLNSQGQKQWDKTIGGNQSESLSSLQQTLDGGYILGGFSESGVSGDKSQPSRGGRDFWVVKIDPNGIKSWDKTFGGPAGDELRTIEQSANGDYLLGGVSYSNIGGEKTQTSRGNLDYWIVRTNNTGNILWDKTFGGTNEDILTSFNATSDGGFILGGTSGSPVSGDRTQTHFGDWDYWVLKLDSTQNKIWEKTYGGANRDALQSIVEKQGGGYILAGYSESHISGNKTIASNGMHDYWLFRLDSIGNKSDEKVVGGSGIDGLCSYKQTSDGGCILAGHSWSGIGGDKSQPSRGGSDFWIVKIGGTLTGIKEPETNFSISIYPNPNQGKFTLQLSNLTAPKAEVTVSDLLGRVVLQQQLNVSNNQISKELTLPNSKGIYLLQLKAGEQIITRKIVVE